MSDVAKELVFIGQGLVNGRLYDLGSYPAAISVCDDEIEGDLFEMLHAERTFERLDDYEGDEYRRALTNVRMEPDGEIEAWIYWYKGKPDERLRIRDKDYRRYLKTKDSLQ